MTRSIRPRLIDIDENIAIILRRAAGKTVEDFSADLDLRYVTFHALMIIAEAASKLPPEFTSGYSDIPWSKIVGLGTKIKHEYHRVDLFIVWSAVTDQLPKLQLAIRKMIQETQ